MRFAHPFFTPLPPQLRPVVKGKGQRMTDFIQTKLEKIPDPQRDPTMSLTDVIGAQGVKDIQATGHIRFHAVGDTGHENSLDQEHVAQAMAKDYNVNNHAASPAFFLHLGDVNYYDNTDKGYHAQFYVPYKDYPGKIIAIPGNHDGELFKWDGSSSGQKKTLEAFWKNFCQPKPGIPPAAGTIYREMVSQPGAYWMLDAPFVNIIGLYSNMAENPGYISGKSIGTKQKDWLVSTLKKLKVGRTKGQSKALIIAVHHPPISHGGHGSSTDMLADIDDACHQAHIMPDMVLAAHAHNYQRFTRSVSFEGKEMQIPFVVAGTGGRGLSNVPKPDGVHTGDYTFDKSYLGYGYTLLSVSAQQLVLEFHTVDSSGTKLLETVTVDLKTSQTKVA